MLTPNDVAKVLDTVLSIPGMNEMVKMDLRLSRKNIFLLNAVIKRGLAETAQEQSNYLLEGIPAETLHELDVFADGCLEKAGLSELSEKLRALNPM